MMGDASTNLTHPRPRVWLIAAWLLAGVGLVAMAGALTFGFTVGSFFEEGGQLVRMPWGIVSLIDVYVGFMLFCMWVAFRERCWWRALLWTILVLTLGNLIACAYVVITLASTRGDWRTFWLGVDRTPSASR